LGSKSNLPGLAHAAHFDVVVGAFAHRHGFVRHVGDAGQQLAKAVVEGFLLVVERPRAPWRPAHPPVRRWYQRPPGAFARSLTLCALICALSCSASVIAARRFWSSSRNCSRPALPPRFARRAATVSKIIPDVCEIEHFPPC
jgi:hypothetical protein